MKLDMQGTGEGEMQERAQMDRTGEEREQRKGQRGKFC